MSWRSCERRVRRRSRRCDRLPMRKAHCAQGSCLRSRRRCRRCAPGELRHLLHCFFLCLLRNGGVCLSREEQWSTATANAIAVGIADATGSGSLRHSGQASLHGSDAADTSASSADLSKSQVRAHGPRGVAKHKMAASRARRADGGGGGEQLPRAVRAAAWARPRAVAGGAGGARAQRRGGNAGQGQAAGVRGRAPKRDGDDRRAAGAGPAVRGPAAAARRRSAGPGARPPSSFCLSFLCSASVQPHGLPPQLLQGALASRGAAAQFASPGLRYV